ncbi:uncharacterized protein PG986_010633 [Apiospora aurea]|uniref:Uncharacterized protein n=1 Tax=Apiospora aurea TaxID=335848 RepID=A0ABR1Q2Y1_9PEZI
METKSKTTISFSEKLETFRRWAKLKQYQIEVTYAVNTYTPIEKVFFYSLVLILFTLSSAAFTVCVVPCILALIYDAWYLLSDDISQIASHLWVANKMMLDTSSGPAASPLESSIMSI